MSSENKATKLVAHGILGPDVKISTHYEMIVSDDTLTSGVTTVVVTVLIG